MKKNLLTAVLAFVAFQLFAQWNASGSNLTTTYHVGIGTSAVNGNLQIVGSSGWDTSTKVFITNGSTDYGRTNLVLTGKIQSLNDAWAFGSDARNSIVFAANSTNTAGSIGTEQFSIQHEMVSNSLGFLSATRGQVPMFVMKQDGKVGIGTVSPSSQLDVANNIRAANPVFPGISLQLDASEIPVINYSRFTGSGQNQHNAFVGQFFNTERSEYSLGLGTGSSTTGDQLANNRVITIPLNGNVGIGTDNPDAKLAVKGDIHTREVRVDMTGAVGPDYVFEKNYDLLPLVQLESYINQNKHLPEVPSAKEMEENGLNLKEMNLILLRKIEELTLHVIDQSKLINELQNERKQSPDVSGKKVEELTLHLIEQDRKNTEQQKEIDQLKQSIKK
jgi:hypothetical protein